MKEKYMKIAIEEAKKALKKGEIPVGTVIVKNNKIISKAYNIKEKKNNSLYHAEIIAINKAIRKNKNWRLNEFELYTTLEPCTMCFGAIIESRIKKIYCGAINNKSHLYNLEMSQNEKIDIEYEILKDECSEILNNFFNKIRK